MLPFNLLSVVIVFPLLLPDSLCVNPQYDECLSNQYCEYDPTEFVFPFRKRGCGLKDFQIYCADDLRPVLQIESTNYTLIDVVSKANRSFTMATDKSFQNCPFSSDGNGTSLGPLNSVFNITNTIIFECSNVCSPYEQYVNRRCPLPAAENVSLELLTVHWNIPHEDLEKCEACEQSNGYCGYKSSSDIVCLCEDGTHSHQCPDNPKGIDKFGAILGGVAAGIWILLIVGVLVAFRKRKSSSASKVEEFLQNFTHEMPTRYSYSQLKKITNNFAEKLGEGGFGVVYRGKLRKGNLVAVKILDQSRHSESQFMNEVATIGRIHHVHLVRLMGYCFESFRSALVYGYMANGSLDKFVFAKTEEPQVLSWEQLYSIALGAARGIAYLHEECDRRIIHFDIKPHNILLDADFTPKVADFGLAKLCGRLDDHISITATRGTPGYVAPELWSRNLGPITDKADVYSFGMVLLEIVGRRKNIDVQVSRSSEVYFPDWVFKHLDTGEVEERLRGRIGEEIGCENDTRMRMCKVGLWCIQYNSADRPTMSRVVQMLEGSGEEVSNPPFPFSSSALPQPALMSSTEQSSTSSISIV